MRDWSANHRSHVDVLGLVLIADRPGRLPRPLRELEQTSRERPRSVAAALGRCWTLGEIPSCENAPRKEVEALRLGLTAALKAARKEAKDA